MTRPTLHLFSLPIELLDSLTPRNSLSNVRGEYQVPKLSAAEKAEVSHDAAQHDTTATRTCNICPGAVFANTDIDGHRSHFRTDWHRYNVKTKLANGKLASERDFAILVEGLEDSLSGSASSSSEDEASETDAVDSLLQRTRIQSRSPSPDSAASRQPLTAIAWFHCPPSFQLGVYRSVFELKTPFESYLRELKAAQMPIPGGRKWAMFMVAGGHFAGLVARVSKPLDAEEPLLQKGKQRRNIQDVEILLHKTFHRYTTRRKQGGSQSLNDNAKGNAKSAGAQLRRYGEQALREDIRGLIAEWADELDGCERIWVRASAANRRIFLDYEESVISKDDERLRTFPFPTRRPTQAELSRCLLELTRVKQTYYTEEELKAQDEEYLASLPKPKAPRPHPQERKPQDIKPVAPKLTKEEEALRDKWERLIDMIKKGRKLDVVRPFWEREGATLGGVDVSIPEWADEKVGSLLQLAASVGQADLTAWLLDDLNADPTVPVPPRTRFGIDVEAMDQGEEEGENQPSASSGLGARRTAYDIASTRDVRDVFRRSSAVRPDAWDWFGAGHVPSALTQEMENERDARKEKQATRKKGLKAKVQERERKKAASAPPTPEPEPEPVAESVPGRFSNAPQKLGGATKANVATTGLTPEMRQKIERERRARAATSRLQGR